MQGDPAHGAHADNDLVISIAYPAAPESVAILRATVGRFATRVGLSPSAVEGVKLAVSEAATNVVVHAYAETHETGLIIVDATVGVGELIVSVADSGPGLRARRASPGLGLGLAIIGQLADKVEMLQGGNGGLRVLMRFAVDSPGGA
jgi:serine/threonine-protein kinase RsbW